MCATLAERGNVVLGQALHLSSTIDTAMCICCLQFSPLGSSKIIDWSLSLACTTSRTMFANLCRLDGSYDK